MKRIAIILANIIMPILAYAQGLTKNAEGESTVLFKGTNIGLDIGKTQLSIGANNLNSTIGENQKFFIGGNIKGENKEGISNLFSKGDLVPAASFDGFIGYSFSNSTYPNNEAARRLVNSEMEKYTNTVLELAKSEMNSEIYKITKDSTLKSLREELLKKISTIESIEELKSELIKDNVDDNDKTKQAKEKIKKKADSLIKNYNKTIKEYNDKLEILNNTIAPQKYWQLLIYGFGGIHASEFKRHLGTDSSNLSKSFDDEKFRGGKGGLGVNFQIKNLTFGLTYSYFETNNFHLLSKKEYSWKSSITQNGQTLSEEKKINAYSGTYSKVIINELNFDFILNLKLDKEAKNHILINPYSRSQLFSRNTVILPNSTNIGCGFYFFQQSGKFLGGFYTELTDVKNNYEKAKPILEQNIRPALNRLTFGVVGKFTFSSLLNRL